MTPVTPSKHTGSCFCGAVRFEAEVDASVGSRCNCRPCTKYGATTSIIKPAAFTLLTDESLMFGHGNEYGHRMFCKTCGVFCFASGHLDQLGGAYVSVNLNCLDGLDPATMKLSYWDGRHDNWEAGARDTPWPVFAAGEA